MELHFLYNSKFIEQLFNTYYKYNILGKVIILSLSVDTYST